MEKGGFQHGVGRLMGTEGGRGHGYDREGGVISIYYSFSMEIEPKKVNHYTPSVNNP